MNSRSLLTGLALLVLFFTLINNFEWNTTPESEIGYSDFLLYLDRGQINSVTISGDSIKGTTVSGKQFKTTGSYDSILIESLRKQSVNIKIEEDDNTPWYLVLLLQWGPLLLLIGVWIFMMRKMPGSGKIMSIGKSKATRYEEKSMDITFKDVAGVEEAKEELEEIVDYLKDPGKFQKLGGKIPKGVLMVGPPGTGKTLLAKAVAGEAGVSFFNISGSDFVEMFVGVGASRVRDLFEEAHKNAPCIIFIDEIDAVGRHRGAGLGSGHDEREQTLNALLVEMDGFDGTEGIITIAATNRVDILDPALLRPGRFDRQVTVSLPDVNGRKKILEVHVKKIVLTQNTDLEVIARGTPGFSGAELANLVNESALRAAQLNKSAVTLEDMEWARDKVMMGAERRSMIMHEEEKEATAYHEAGHALVAYYLKDADPIHKITIIPRGQSLGMTTFLPETDRLSMNRDGLIARIKVALGGRAAEELMLKDFSTGVEGDLKDSTNIAYQMICKWGMSEKLGALSIPQGDSGNYLAMDYNAESSVSEEIQEIVDEEVQDLLQDCYTEAKKILSDHASQLKSLADMLVEVETVSLEQLTDLFQPVAAPEAEV
ncbi:MAG: ATP-dependent zinc metalloprotease FtsH [Deltaproteobacteria bacterium]|nr:ATP-dependent zinc metalloprotease FtsH [Deltaproteobacteria bacterium]MBT4263962.1 ATP-dependent zinc metalloprotease FtsH [Deltaproteobacteria bacterium]MBT4639905.1 ATP-dependent zinc metalloprotease FtsH [Deltaproteobacteria bacterium]MBT6498517.1 ATP-dependent zinc metalloprotease FtsH [Deltaproteobacteria bacterium]MBT7712347.1 ATP-dependent zinc metalloprotease FtsH [Deltaproteobacteria bacterium]